MAPAKAPDVVARMDQLGYDVAAGSVAVDVFDALNGDMKPDLFMDRLSESIMASTWIILMQLQHDGLS